MTHGARGGLLSAWVCSAPRLGSLDASSSRNGPLTASQQPWSRTRGWRQEVSSGWSSRGLADCCYQLAR